MLKGYMARESLGTPVVDKTLSSIVIDNTEVWQFNARLHVFAPQLAGLRWRAIRTKQCVFNCGRALTKGALKLFAEQ